VILFLGIALAVGPARAADKPGELHIGYAYYNPVGLVLKDKGWLEEIGGLVDAGKLRIIVEREFPLAEAVHKLIETGHVRGKIIPRVI
jgi:NADPH:quinone reductase-like Zn-dependent oxidoreductase